MGTYQTYCIMSLIRTSDIEKIMVKYMIVFRWLAQVGGASSCRGGHTHLM